ncbi:metal-sulfur cluster assembly factor [Pseudonocardia endophytica]|uniref:Metal-sulfur cluster biosynthetic enzyme n=1 Tax=Pseudonocardia endophytica TaxID=401976 RepID=A0A4R1HXX0_PSEEN|nr:metal-sulfur cluster assembly factor [Pseudonocardia endophytica]TCK27627.1 metal-sulfur cluster biosynthetic enzyme [Pseudonocardia endophytica]
MSRTDTLATEAITEQITEALTEVLDPDLGVNVVDLGFLYGITLDDGAVTLTMTLTSPACPLTKPMEDQIQIALVDGGLVTSATVDWVFQPPWSPARITPDGRDQLRAIGFNL